MVGPGSGAALGGDKHAKAASGATVVRAGKEYPPEALRRLVDALRGRIPGDGGRTAFVVPDGPLTAAGVLWAQNTRQAIVLLPSELQFPEALALASEFACVRLVYSREATSTEFQVLSVRPAGADLRGGSRRYPVWLCTSGTTGQPKPVPHNWESLRNSVRVSGQLCSARWMSLYPLTRFAGFNTLLHALWNGSTLVVPGNTTPSGLAEEMARSHPTHVSGTPTLWKIVLMHARAAEWMVRVRQVTTGGETVDQPTLNALRARFPHARVTHIYASTEAGVCIVVSDGLAGFPARWLEDSTREVQLSLRDGELWIRRIGSRSALLAEGGSEGWWPTGDKVEVRGDRAFFLGRGTEILNVGGAKVAPAMVEGRIREVPGVEQVRILGKKNPLAGMLIQAEIVPAPNTNHDDLRRTVLRHCRSTLPNYAVPRKVEFVTDIPVSSSGKLIREGDQ